MVNFIFYQLCWKCLAVFCCCFSPMETHDVGNMCNPPDVWYLRIFLGGALEKLSQWTFVWHRCTTPGGAAAAPLWVGVRVYFEATLRPIQDNTHSTHDYWTSVSSACFFNITDMFQLNVLGKLPFVLSSPCVGCVASRGRI